AAPLLVQQAIVVDDDAVEGDVDRLRRVESELLRLVRHLDVAAVDEEGGDPARARRPGIRAREEQDCAPEAAVRDPLLRAADAPAAVGALGTRRPRARLGP